VHVQLFFFIILIERKNAEDRPYYIDHNRGITTWNRPIAQNPQVEDRHQLYDMKMNDELGPLPHGWQMTRNDNGRVYFIDHDNKKTTWVSSIDNYSFEYYSDLYVCV
jgi:E3 ubiquitin-protein ligase NEDD4